MRWIVAILAISLLCVPVSGAGPEQAIVGQTVNLEMKIPAGEYEKIECILSLDESQVQLQSLPSAQGYSVEFNGMTMVITKKEGGSSEILLKLKLRILPVSDDTKITVALKEIKGLSGGEVVPLGEVIHEITVVPPASGDNYLTALEIEGGSLSPQFHPDILQYTAEVPANCQQPQVQAEGADKSRVEIQITPFTEEGMCVVTLVVTAENGSQRSYTIQVTRAKPQETEPSSDSSEPTKATLDTLQPDDSPTDSKNEGTPEWLVAVAVLAGAAFGGAGGILLSQKKSKDR